MFLSVCGQFPLVAVTFQLDTCESSKLFGFAAIDTKMNGWISAIRSTVRPQMLNHMLFIRGGDATQTLESVASLVFSVLCVEMREERFSSNYPPDDHYFAGYAENIELTVYDNEITSKSGYPFNLTIEKATWRKGRKTIDDDPVRIAQALANAGLVVFIPLGAWYKVDWDGRGDVYGV